MAAKLDAAEIAMHAGGLVVIANGKTPGILEQVFRGDEVGTLFLPGSRMAGKRRWLAFATTVRGQATINANAADALLHRQASLLVSGVTACQGEFSAGQVIAVVDADGDIIGKGIAEYSSQQLSAMLAVQRQPARCAGTPGKLSDSFCKGNPMTKASEVKAPSETIAAQVGRTRRAARTLARLSAGTETRFSSPALISWKLAPMKY